LTKKTHRQACSCEKRPPSVGPTTEDSPDAGEVALHPRPLGDGVDVPGDGDRHRLHRTGTEPLDRAERDEDRHAPGEPTQDRAEQEEPDAEQDQRFAAHGVGQLGVDRHGDRLGEEIDGEQPGELREAAQVLDDGGDGGREDRRVDGDDAARDHEGEKDRASLGPQSDAGVRHVRASSVCRTCLLGVPRRRCARH